MKKNIILRCFLLFLGLAYFSAMIYPKSTEYPIIQSMSYFPYSDNTLLEKNDFSLNLNLYYSNIYMFNREKTVVNDFENLSTIFEFRYGLARGVNIEIYLRHFVIFGGILDKFIEDFHDFLELSDNHRPVYTRNSVHYKYNDSFFYTDKKGCFSPVILSFLGQIYESPHFSIKSRIALGLPLSNTPGLSSDKPFLSPGLILTYKKDWFSIDFINYLSFFKKPVWLKGEDIRSFIYKSEIKLHIKRFITGFIFRTSPFRKGDISRKAYQIYIGFKVFKSLDFIFLEDFSPFDTTPDISFNIRVKLFNKK